MSVGEKKEKGVLLMLFMPLKDHIYKYIVEQIKEGKIKPNEKINETDITRALDVSRTPVREALIELRADGFLDSSPRRGFRVKPLYKDDAEDLYIVMGTLDALAGKLACEHLSESDIKLMEEYTDKMEEALNNFNFSTYLEIQDEFHNIYIQKSKNNILINTIEKLNLKLVRQKYVNKKDLKLQEVLLNTNQEHKELIEAFKNHDLELIRTNLKSHWSINHAQLEAFDDPYKV